MMFSLPTTWHIGERGCLRLLYLCTGVEKAQKRRECDGAIEQVLYCIVLYCICSICVHNDLIIGFTSYSKTSKDFNKKASRQVMRERILKGLI